MLRKGTDLLNGRVNYAGKVSIKRSLSIIILMRDISISLIRWVFILFLEYLRFFLAKPKQAEDSVCLSEFCDIMRCDVFQSEESKLSGSDSAISTDIEVWGSSAFGKLSSSSALVKTNHNLSPIRDSTVLTGGSKKHQARHVCPEQISGQTNTNSKNAKGL